MFLHKQGCEYYLTIFKHVVQVTENHVNDTRNSYSISTVSEYDMRKVLFELGKHVENAREHIQSEKNVLMLFAQNIDSHMKDISITDPKKIKLVMIINEFSVFNTLFNNLKTAIDNSLNGIANNDAKTTLGHYQSIVSILKSIREESTKTARNLSSLIHEMQKEKELIIKEGAALTDFNKNMMSWF